MSEPITSVLSSTALKALVSTIVSSTYKLLSDKLKDSDSDIEIGDDTRASLETYYERMTTTLRPVRLFHFNDTRWLDQIYVSLKINRKRENPFRGWDQDQLEDYVRQLDQGEFTVRETLLEQATKRYDDTAILNTGKQLVVLGRPGSGKTTFLKHLSIAYIQAQVPELVEELGILPIFCLSARSGPEIGRFVDGHNRANPRPLTQAQYSCIFRGMS